MIKIIFKFQSDSINTTEAIVIEYLIPTFKFQSDSINTATYPKNLKVGEGI